MKILLTGGGTGGHFYPIIAIAAELNRLTREHKMLSTELFYMASQPYDESKLYEQNITFIKIPSGKIRRYGSLLNILDFFKIAYGTVLAFWHMFHIYPDVVFGKGGYDSFPALLAARLLGIPVLIHESDSRPGRVNAWAAKFAKKIAVGYPETADFIDVDQDKIAFTGNPIRPGLTLPQKEGAFEYLNLEHGIPVLYISGGSQGSRTINEHLVDIAPRLVEKYQIIHQTGIKLENDTNKLLSIILEQSPHKSRYHVFPYLNDVALKMIAGVATLAVSRAGSGTISELSAWQIPSILVPIPEEVSHDQHQNAFAYARTGGAIVIDEKNLTAQILYNEIERIMSDPNTLKTMRDSAKKFARPDAATVIAKGILELGTRHA